MPISTACAEASTLAIRYIQALLGHSDLSTTEVYTRVSILQLKAVHDRTHPARVARQAARTGAADQDGQTSADTVVQGHAGTRTPSTGDIRGTLGTIFGRGR